MQTNLFLQRLQKHYPEYFRGKKVMEAGGCVHRYFTNCSYTVQHGRGVAPIHRVDAPGAHEVIVNAGVLHYDRHWINTLCAMYRNLAPGGALMITCAGPQSPLDDDDDMPDRYNLIGIDEITALLPVNAFSVYNIGYCTKTNNLEFFGVKK